MTSSAPIEFHIPGNSEACTDLNNIKSYLKIKVTKADGSKIDQATEFVVLNDFEIASLFQDGWRVEAGDISYVYIGYLKTVSVHAWSWK